MNATLPAVGSRWFGLRDIAPKLAQPWWHKLVGFGHFQLCECGHPKGVHRVDGTACIESRDGEWCDCTGWAPEQTADVATTIAVDALAPDEKRRMRREARKRFKRASRAAIATAAKRKDKRRKELVVALRRVA
jgi:hypothetical protein